MQSISYLVPIENSCLWKRNRGLLIALVMEIIDIAFLLPLDYVFTY